MKIFLDDIRPAPLGWTRTYTVQETIKLLGNFRVTELSLDHDLGEGQEDGYSVLCWIERQVANHHFTPPKIHIHTDNPAGRERMRLALQSINKLRGAVNGH